MAKQRGFLGSTPEPAKGGVPEGSSFGSLVPEPALGPRSYTSSIRSLEELLERDRLRVLDGFPPKIRIGRMIKPGGGGKDKVVIVPTTVEEKLLHDRLHLSEEEEGSGGSGKGEEGEVIGEQPVRPEGQEGEGQAGEGQGGAHEIESSAYDLGRILTEKFELPNLKDKGKKKSLTRYVYDYHGAAHLSAGQNLPHSLQGEGF